MALHVGADSGLFLLRVSFVSRGVLLGYFREVEGITRGGVEAAFDAVLALLLDDVAAPRLFLPGPFYARFFPRSSLFLHRQFSALTFLRLAMFPHQRVDDGCREPLSGQCLLLGIWRFGMQAANLKLYHTWLLDSLLRFKRPNAKSRSALDVTRVVIGNHKMDVNSKLKTVALEVSKQLMLDEVQSYILVSRCFNDDEPSFSNTESFQKVSLKYFTERQCLLKCVRLLLLSQTAEPTSSKELELEVNSLVKGGLEDKLLAVLKMLMTVEQPLDMDMMYINLWAEQVVREEHLVLDAMFLMYFKPICSCSFARWKELFVIFKERVFLGTNADRLSVTAEASTLIEHVKHQCLLIMLEGLDLDKLLVMVHEDIPFSHDRHPFSVPDLLPIDGLLVEINALEVQDYAPLLLGWGIFGCLVSFLPAPHTGALDTNHTFYTNQAYEAGGLKYIHDMLCHKTMQETPIDGYKCVIKSVISTFVAAYDIMSQTDSAVLDNVICILNLVHCGQEMLCTEFWDRENILDGPLRNLLYSLRQNFPYERKTFVQLLAGLAEGTWPAECVGISQCVTLTAFTPYISWATGVSSLLLNSARQFFMLIPTSDMPSLSVNAITLSWIQPAGHHCLPSVCHCTLVTFAHCLYLLHLLEFSRSLEVVLGEGETQSDGFSSI
ncbi:hypothetical protein L7F22_060745 [Adiantum nelumboides]|nr:hypothetical protein [Adiantum nelumboides]